MLKRRKTNRLRSTGPRAITTPAPPTEKPPRKFTQAITYLVKSAAEYALQHIWGVLGGAIVAALIAFWLYIRTGRASWLYPWLKYTAAFMCGWFSLTLILMILSIRQQRELRAIERAKNARFTSTEKGYLDHIKNQKRGWKEVNSILPEINKEIARFGRIAAKAGRLIDISNRLLGVHGANVVHGIATRTAKKLNKRAQAMEEILEKLGSVSALLFESNLGYVRWFNPTTPEQRSKFEADRAGMVAMLNATHAVIPVMEGFRTSQNSTRGITQELNTAANRMEHATNNLIAFLRKWERESQQIIDEISRKLD